MVMMLLMVMMVVVVVVLVVDDDADGGDADGDDVADRHMVASMQRLWTPRRLVKHASCGVQIVGLSFVRRLFLPSLAPYSCLAL